MKLVLGFTIQVKGVIKGNLGMVELVFGLHLVNSRNDQGKFLNDKTCTWVSL